jgi:hypothetical protein
MFPANTLLPDRIRDFRHLDAMYPKLYVDYANAIWPGAQSNVYQIGNPEWHKFDDPLLDLAAVKYVALHEPPRNVPASFDTVYSDAEVTIYRNNRAFARALCAERAPASGASDPGNHERADKGLTNRRFSGGGYHSSAAESVVPGAGIAAGHVFARRPEPDPHAGRCAVRRLRGSGRLVLSWVEGKRERARRGNL